MAARKRKKTHKSKHLKDMDVDEFMSVGLMESDEDEFKTEKQTLTGESERSQSADKTMSHKESLTQLQETDPEFFQFLKDNDQKLLEFSESESEPEYEFESEAHWEDTSANDDKEEGKRRQDWSDDQKEVCSRYCS
jgi:nucleolar complex protein 2